MCSFRLSSLPARRLAAGAPLTFLCWPSSFQRTPANSPRFLAPRSFRLRVQKYYIFPYLQQLFSFFFNLSPSALNVSKINFTFFAIIAAERRFFSGKRGSGGPPGGRPAPLERPRRRLRGPYDGSLAATRTTRTPPDKLAEFRRIKERPHKSRPASLHNAHLIYISKIVLSKIPRMVI